MYWGQGAVFVFVGEFVQVTVCMKPPVSAYDGGRTSGSVFCDCVYAGAVIVAILLTTDAVRL